MHAGSGSVLYARDGLGPPLRGDPLIVTLKQEKAALLAATDNDRGDKANLLATSKKALGQAAQLASDAAEARKRSSEAAFQMIAARSATYLSQRLETLLPSAVVSAELAAVKGEMSLAKVADKASVSLTAVEEVFNVVVAAAAFPAREVDAAADLHRWHLGAMGMLFRSVSSSPPLTSSANIGGGGDE